MIYPQECFGQPGGHGIGLAMQIGPNLGRETASFSAQLRFADHECSRKSRFAAHQGYVDNKMP